MSPVPSSDTDRGAYHTEEPELVEPRFRAVLRHAPLGIAVTDLEGTILEANPKLASFLGCSPDDLVGRSYSEFTPSEDLASERRIFEELVSGRRDSYRLDKRYRTAAGEVRWGHLAVSLLRDPHGEPRFSLGMVEDITEQRRMGEALRNSEAKYRHLFETMSQGVVYQDVDGKILAANPAAEEILGLPVEEMKGRTSEDPRWQPFREDGTPFPGLEHPAMAALRTGREVRGVVMGVWNPRQQGRRWIRIHAVPKFDGGSETPSQVYTVFEDITARRADEERLAAYQNQLRAMAAELSVVEDRERERFAGELHDSVGQVLALARIKLNSASNRASDPALAEVDELLESAIRQTRSLTFDLSPPVLHELGLRPALEWLLDETERRHGIATDLSSCSAAIDLDERTRSLVFRVLQELVTNAVKHGRPRRIRVHLWEGGGRLTAQVWDDGIGFEPECDQGLPPGFGLFSVRERLEAAGGRLEIESAPSRGSRLTITVPLNPAAPAPG